MSATHCDECGEPVGRGHLPLCQFRPVKLNKWAVMDRRLLALVYTSSADLGGRELPPFHGVAWRYDYKDETVTMLMPFNIIAACVRSLWLAMRYPWTITLDARGAYQQGLRDGRAQARKEFL